MTTQEIFKVIQRRIDWHAAQAETLSGLLVELETRAGIATADQPAILPLPAAKPQTLEEFVAGIDESGKPPVTRPAKREAKPSRQERASQIAAALADGPVKVNDIAKKLDVTAAVIYEVLRQFGETHPMGSHFKSGEHGYSLTSVGISNLRQGAA